LLSTAIWIVVLLGLVEKVNINQTIDFRQTASAGMKFSMNFIATDVTLIDRLIDCMDHRLRAAFAWQCN
jgi:hypothetical protein